MDIGIRERVSDVAPDLHRYQTKMKH